MKTLSPENIGCLQSRRLARNGALTLGARRWLSTIVLVVLGLVLARGASIAQGADFQSGSYSGTRPNGGKIILKFDGKGRFTLTDEDGKALVEGAYKVMKDQIEFTDEKGPIASKDAKPGKYKWKLEAKALNFTKVEDESEGRSKGITGTTWTLEK